MADGSYVASYETFVLSAQCGVDIDVPSRLVSDDLM